MVDGIRTWEIRKEEQGSHVKCNKWDKSRHRVTGQGFSHSDEDGLGSGTLKCNHQNLNV